MIYIIILIFSQEISKSVGAYTVQLEMEIVKSSMKLWGIHSLNHIHQKNNWINSVFYDFFISLIRTLYCYKHTSIMCEPIRINESEMIYTQLNAKIRHLRIEHTSFTDGIRLYELDRWLHFMEISGFCLCMRFFPIESIHN